MAPRFIPLLTLTLLPCSTLWAQGESPAPADTTPQMLPAIEVHGTASTYGESRIRRGLWEDE